MGFVTWESRWNFRNVIFGVMLLLRGFFRSNPLFHSISKKRSTNLHRKATSNKQIYMANCSKNNKQLEIKIILKKSFSRKQIRNFAYNFFDLFKLQMSVYNLKHLEEETFFFAVSLSSPLETMMCGSPWGRNWLKEFFDKSFFIWFEVH